MGSYILLSNSNKSSAFPLYKGLDRVEPFPRSGADESYLSLWYRYVEGEFGVTTELSLSELRELADKATQNSGEDYEIVYFDKTALCPHPSLYYGVDVIGAGGYSMLKEGLFSTAHESNHNRIYGALNHYFLGKLNEYGLFSDEKIAEHLRDVLHEINILFPGSIEIEEWRTVHVYKIL